MKTTIATIALTFYCLGTVSQNTFPPTGNVGIGTTSPAAHLEVVKNVNGTNSAYFLNQNTSANARVFILVGEQPVGMKYGTFAHHSSGYVSQWGDYSSASSTWLSGNDVNGLNIIAGNQQGKIVFGTSTTEKMRLTNSGNLAIGTTDTKGFKLGVNGKIAATEVKVAMYSNWSDFVFHQNYDLPTLKEVEQYIQEQGHLKDIPSAEEIKENGFFLGEMDSKLLQKIEELTLYTIQQYKDIENLKKENASLKTMNAKLLELQKRLERLERQ